MNKASVLEQDLHYRHLHKNLYFITVLKNSIPIQKTEKNI